VKGARPVAAAGLIAATILLAGGFSLREPVWWWWRFRNVVQIRVMDGVLAGFLSLQDAPAVSRAAALTRKLLESLPETVDEAGAGQRISAILFLDGEHSVTGPSISLVERARGRLGRVESETALLQSATPLLTYTRSTQVLECFDRCYACTPLEWESYLRDMLTPLARELTVVWKDPGREPTDRFFAAKVLALVNPGNEGLVEFLRDALRTDRQDDAIAALGMMGPAAGPAIPALEALSVEEQASVVTRAAAAEALARIRPDPSDAGKLVQ